MVNMAGCVFLFPGQGAQYPGMALDFFDASPSVQQLFELASEVMGADMRMLLRDSDEEMLKRTDIAQPAITLANLAACYYLAGLGISASAAAGFSLGEYAALVAAGVLGAEACFKLVEARGRAMQRSADALTAHASAPGMAAVIGLGPETVESLIAEWKTAGLTDLYGANYNSPKQVVVSGTAAALAAAAERFKAEGARRVIPLAVAGPFHSPLIADAAEEFRPVLEAAVFNDPLIPCYSNVSGKAITSGSEAKKLALLQITSPVRWTDEEAVIAGAITEAQNCVLLETGPGKVLQGLWKDSGSGLPCYASGSVADIDKFLEITRQE
ncbi:malonyl CoA-acyl carrier protein transacylase [Spirochaetia bacterium]|nr:malonyl CoA-acyl carrier protein transacylase [Spirochaetia bacterium]